MDAYLAIVSRRDERSFAQRPVGEDLVGRLLDAGRLAGSAHNGQPCRFLVVEDRGVVSQLAVCAFSPGLVVLAPLVIVVAVSAEGTRFAPFDAGRAAQNMLLAGWHEGLASCPAGLHDPRRAASVLRLEPGEEPVVVLCFGHPREARDPARRAVAEWVRRARRRPAEEVVRRLRPGDPTTP
jgi:nitroreductase